jgi:2'-5' RNA ligase
MPISTRRQATLYLPPPDGERVEWIRSHFNPLQFGLIRAHVTLCREDEVGDWDELSSRLTRLGTVEVELTFGKPVRDRNLVHLPAVGSTESFDTLRDALLAVGGSRPRKHDPHITLIHPRNGTCSDAAFEEIARRCEPFSTTFRAVSLIEQVDGGAWKEWTGIEIRP